MQLAIHASSNTPSTTPAAAPASAGDAKPADAPKPAASTRPVPDFDRHQLRVKIKSLAAEARIIRTEEQRVRTQSGGKIPPGFCDSPYHSLRQHRVLPLRAEQRSALLAYAFLRGRSYRSVERRAHDDRRPFSRSGPNKSRIVEIVAKFSRLHAQQASKTRSDLIWADLLAWLGGK